MESIYSRGAGRSEACPWVHRARLSGTGLCDCRRPSAGEVTRIEAWVSPNLMKNGLGVTVPGTGMVGLPIAAALGAIGGNAHAGLEVLKDATADALVRAKALLEAGQVQVKLQEACDEILYSRACVYAGDLGNGDHRGRAYPGGGSGLPGKRALRWISP